MVKQYKIDAVNVLVEKLREKSNIIFTDYSGVTVGQLSDLRRKLRESDADYKVVKNNLFKRALREAGYEGVDDYIKGPVAVAFTGETVAETAKVLKEFGKGVESFSYTGAVLDNVVYDESQVAKIADLPSKDQLLSQSMSLINGPATHIAMGMKQIITSLARGIKLVAEQNGQ